MPSDNAVDVELFLDGETEVVLEATEVPDPTTKDKSAESERTIQALVATWRNIGYRRRDTGEILCKWNVLEASLLESGKAIIGGEYENVIARPTSRSLRVVVGTEARVVLFRETTNENPHESCGRVQPFQNPHGFDADRFPLMKKAWLEHPDTIYFNNC